MGPGVAAGTPSALADRQAGLTLIELAVVIAVMAALAVGASLSAGRQGARETADLVRFQDTYTQLRSLAVHGGEQQGLVITTQGHRLAWKRAGVWQVSERLQPWKGPVSYLAEGQGAPGRGAPDLIFLPNGQTSAFRIQLGRSRCRSDGWTGLTCSAG